MKNLSRSSEHRTMTPMVASLVQAALRLNLVTKNGRKIRRRKVKV